MSQFPDLGIASIFTEDFLTNTSVVKMDKSVCKEILNDFLKAIFDPELKRLGKLMDVIQDDHQLRSGSRAFMLDGRPIWNGDAQAARDKCKKPLHESQVEEAKFIQLQFTKVNLDKQRMTNFFAMLETRCESFQDFRDALPDMVVAVMEHPNIKGLLRTREPGYVFMSSPVKFKVFEDACKNMMHYLINRLVF
jgi:hypothetical protein